MTKPHRIFLKTLKSVSSKSLKDIGPTSRISVSEFVKICKGSALNAHLMGSIYLLTVGILLYIRHQVLFRHLGCRSIRNKQESLPS